MEELRAHDIDCPFAFKVAAQLSVLLLRLPNTASCSITLKGDLAVYGIVFTMLLEEQRFLHEDLERLEQGISDRVAEDPRHVPLTASQ